MSNVSTLAEFGTGQLLWSMLWFFMFIVWFWLLITVFGDIFRSDDLGGLAEGSVDHLHRRVHLARGTGVPHRPRQGDAAAHHQCDAGTAAAQQDYIRSVAAPSTAAVDQIASAKALLDSGAITQQEFDAIKNKALA